MRSQGSLGEGGLRTKLETPFGNHHHQNNRTGVRQGGAAKIRSWTRVRRNGVCLGTWSWSLLV